MTTTRRAPSLADQASGDRARQGVGVGSEVTHRKKRQALRRRLRELGLPEEFIERRIEVTRLRQQAERDGDTDEARRLGDLERDLVHEQTYLVLSPDDRAFRPTSIDPLLRGPARATRRTAKAARRTKATTRFELRIADGLDDEADHGV